MKKCNQTRVKNRENISRNHQFWVGEFMFKNRRKPIETLYFKAVIPFISAI
jgi:hypothetical protein